ncbi:MAG: hypothetical protein RIB60_10605 [Phycisphaerales bacterium]
MSVAAVLAGALLAAPLPDAEPEPIDTQLRLRPECVFEFAELREQTRSERHEPSSLEHAVRFGTPAAGGPVIRRYICDEHGVLEHGVIYAYPEIHARPYTPGEAHIIDIGPDYGVLSDTPDDD